MVTTERHTPGRHRRHTQAQRSAHFAATAHGTPPRSRIQLVGELDHASAPTLAALLDDVRAAGSRHLTLDLSGVTFLAAAGMAVFGEADRIARDTAGSVELTRPRDRDRRLLQLTGLDTAAVAHPDPGTDDRAQATPHGVPPHLIRETSATRTPDSTGANP